MPAMYSVSVANSNRWETHFGFECRSSFKCYSSVSLVEKKGVDCLVTCKQGNSISKKG